jgi:hypothetical protein
MLLRRFVNLSLNVLQGTSRVWHVYPVLMRYLSNMRLSCLVKELAKNYGNKLSFQAETVDPVILFSTLRRDTSKEWEGPVPC